MYENTVIFIIILAVFLGSIELVDIGLNYKLRRTLMEKLSLRKRPSELSQDNPDTFQTVALGRTLMTYAIIVVIGAALFYMLETLAAYLNPLLPDKLCNYCTNSTSGGNHTQIIDIIKNHEQTADDISRSLAEIIKNIATILGGAVSAIVGFYFGSRAVEGAMKGSKDKDGGDGSDGKKDNGDNHDQPSIMANPVKAAADQPLVLVGNGFAPNSNLKISVGGYNANVPSGIKSGNEGAFAVGFAVPSGFNAGYRTKITVKDEKGNSAETDFEFA